MDDKTKRWDTNAIHVAPIFSGSLSAISSSLIIYVILRSKTKLSSIYHRIMFGMSIADILSSISIALSTLPMPSSMPKEEEYLYKNWQGRTRLGNTYTCNVQGFFQTFGFITTIHYNCMLCFYYACAIAFAMQEKTIKKRLEPILHAVPIAFGLVPSLFFLFNDLYNPQIGDKPPYTSWCTPTGYPMDCGNENDECIRGYKAEKLLVISSCITSFQSFVIIVGSLGLVIRRVIVTKRMLFDTSNQTIANMEDLLEKHINTKAVLIQAILYVAAFLICVIPPFIRYFVEQGKNASENVSLHLLEVTLFLLPLQGFFNFVIFISYKVYNYRRMNRGEPITQVLRLLFFTSTHEPCFISRISIVRHHEDEHVNENVERIKSMEIMTQDEGCSEVMRYRLQIMTDAFNSHNAKVDGTNDAVIIDEGSMNGLSHDTDSAGLSLRSSVDDCSFPSRSPLSIYSEDDSSSHEGINGQVTRIV